MISVEEARLVVIHDIHKYSENLTKYVIYHEEEFEKGWCFSIQSRVYIETGDKNKMVIGAGPLIVDKYTGDLHTYSSSCSRSGAMHIYLMTGKSGLDIEKAMWLESDVATRARLSDFYR